MKAQFVQIRDQQKEIWNRFSPGWKKWDDQTMSFLKPFGDEIIKFIRPDGVDMVLDVASGTGEPGLTIATKLTGGIVVLTDLSEGMLNISRENAKRRSIKNLEFVTCDVSELPFSDNSFDAISCRFGFMFFPDMLLAAKEMVRVLKPGGRIATSVWDRTEKNFWASAIFDVINSNMHLISPPEGAPGIFRCARKGFIEDLFNKAGLKNITETNVGGKLIFRNAETYWNYMTEVVAPIVDALGKADFAMKRNIKNMVLELVNQKYSNGKIEMNSNAHVIYGEK